jgi:hypothetical protein
MKKIIYTLFVLVGFISMGFTQEKSEIANTEGKTELLKSRESGEYVFVLPARLTKDQVAKNASYYTNMFSVAFDENSYEAKVTILDNAPKSRFVIARFLSACGIRFVKVNDDFVDITEFINQYLK